MANHCDSQVFDHYELVPREQPLRPPTSDRVTHLRSKPILQSHTLQSKLSEQSHCIEQLQLRIQQLTSELQLTKGECAQMVNVIESAKSILGKPWLSISEFLEQICQAVTNKKGSAEAGEDIVFSSKLRDFDTLLRQKQSQIRSLRSQLLESTSNNISALLTIELSPDQCVLKQIGAVKQEIAFLRNSTFNKQNCAHQHQTFDLLRNYEQMLSAYHRNQFSAYEIKPKQEQYFKDLTALKSEIAESIQQKLSLTTSIKLAELESKLKQIHQMQQHPQRVRRDDQADYRFRELIAEIETLNERVLQRQIQMEKLRETNQTLMVQNRQCEGCKERLQTISRLQAKLKERDKRIEQLQSAIVDHIDSRAKVDSQALVDSDFEKHKNTVRNLKAVVASLKEENHNMKSKLKEVNSENKELQSKLQQMSAESFGDAEKAYHDDAPLKAVENMIEVPPEDHQPPSTAQ